MTEQSETMQSALAAAKPSAQAGDDEPVWGADNMAPIINKSVRSTRYLLACGAIDARKVGGQWVSTRGKLRRSIGLA